MRAAWWRRGCRRFQSTGRAGVGDSRWAQGGHGDLADNDLSACATCHGADFPDTVRVAGTSSSGLFLATEVHIEE